MTGQPPHTLPALDLAEQIRAGAISAREAVQSCLDAIERWNGTLNAIVTTDAEGALAEASRLDGARAAHPGPLAGVPIAIKDITETTNLPTTFGSRAVLGTGPRRDALVVQRIRAAGGIVLAKSAVPEFALRPTTESLRYGPTRNPWNTQFGSGGSSGGAAVSVAATMLPLAQGTDGGGSIRIPAACNGIVGIKPSRGRVPAAPAYYESWAGLSTDGALARTVRDAALLLEVMSGPTLGDPYAVALGDSDFSRHCEQRLSTCTVAYTLQPPHGAVSSNVAGPLQEAVQVLEDMGHRVIEGSPDLSGLYDHFLTVLAGNAGALRYDVLDEQLSALEGSTLALMLGGSAVTGAQYCRAIDELRRSAARIMSFWENADFLVTPVLTHLPRQVGEMPSSYQLTDRWDEYMDWQAFAYPFNVTGQPAISLPAGTDPATNLPIAIQIVAAPGQEAPLFSLAAAFEEARPWQSPPLQESLSASAQARPAEGDGRNAL